MFISRDINPREQFRSLVALEHKNRTRLPLLAHLVRHFAPSIGLILTTWSEVLVSAGLGGSNALNIAISRALASLTHRCLNRQKLIAVARDTEVRVIAVPTGEQDYYAAVYGSLSAIHLDLGGTWHEPLPANFCVLEAHLILAYTGKPRHSGINNWEVTKAHLDARASVIRNFDRLTEISFRLCLVLRANDWQRVGELIDAEWHHRHRNVPTISTPGIDCLMQVARRVGALAGKFCGTGGGGCIVFYCPPQRHLQAAQGLLAAGATVLPFQIARRGVCILRERR